jgi:subtilase family serine protease
VQTWLKSQGFSVEYTPQNNHYVSAEGTVAQAEAAFGTTFGEYSVGGLTVRSTPATARRPRCGPRTRR